MMNTSFHPLAHDDVLADHLTADGCRGGRLEREPVLMLLLVPLAALGTEWIPRQSTSSIRSSLTARSTIDSSVAILVRVKTQIEKISRQAETTCDGSVTTSSTCSIKINCSLNKSLPSC